jgi:uncharacterized protein YndB with AHSA1/START domain
MPLKRDDSGRRWVEMEFLVPGTVEQVWRAIATGPGLTAWFTPTTLDERVGGAISFDFGEGDCGEQTSSGTVTEWDPPHRLAYEEHEWSGEAPPVATEVVVTSHSGDRCVVRMVHSLFTSKDDWDDELESFETGWPGFFDVLRVYLRNFAGKPAAIAHAAVRHPGAAAETWSRLIDALNLRGVNVGDHHETFSPAPRLAGVVEKVHQDSFSRDVMIRLDEPSDGIAIVGTCQMGEAASGVVSLYLYGESAAELAAAEQPKWEQWLAEVLPRDRVTT